jgi:hypothetical protein
MKEGVPHKIRNEPKFDILDFLSSLVLRFLNTCAVLQNKANLNIFLIFTAN